MNGKIGSPKSRNHNSCPSNNSLVTNSTCSRISSDNECIDQNSKISSTLTLVDLAGSESVRYTDATGDRLKEGANINKSLLSLSNVIRALSNSSTGNGGFVNYRDSKLTLLLKPSLSGNAKMAIVCCITPASKYGRSILLQEN